jgi:hypothetical protein
LKLIEKNPKSLTRQPFILPESYFANEASHELNRDFYTIKAIAWQVCRGTCTFSVPTDIKLRIVARYRADSFLDNSSTTS